jgi:hypothetical protein
VIDLVQDVNILRPLVFMASRDFGFETLLLLSAKFAARDVFGIWQNEIEQICLETGARLEHFGSDLDAHRHLDGQGLLFTASESHLENHSTTRNLLRHAPPAYLRVTLQHGFESVGLRHSADHVRAYGETASFGSDIICTWADPDQLPSLAPSQRPKVLVTGPTSLLQMPTGSIERQAGAPGLICENLHSVRYNRSLGAKSEFVDTFSAFARIMARQKRRVALRPHVGGQYFLSRHVALPLNVRIENAPLYRVDLRQFSYGISAPSSVIIDMLLAQIPTAVWRDQAGGMDASSYEGLAVVSSAQEWAHFARAAEKNPESILSAQHSFLQRQAMPLEPSDVFSRFAQIFHAAKRMEVRPAGSVAERERLLFVADHASPTLQRSFYKPLAPLIGRGEVASRLLTEQHLRDLAEPESARASSQRIEHYLDSYGPSAIVFCRYSGAAYQPILDWARRERVPVIYYIDDDPLAVPQGNDAHRQQAVATLLKSADLVYASTERLKTALLEQMPGLSIVAGGLQCTGTVLRRPRRRDVRTVGCLAGADHTDDLDLVVPAIEALLERNLDVRFEIFGAMTVPKSLARFGPRIVTNDPIQDYDEFLEAFSRREWDIGLCPVRPTDANGTKGNGKWVECTAAGAAVVASGGTIYDESCADGCGILAATPDEWTLALDLLANNVDERLAMVERAQARLERQYNMTRLRNQVLEIIAEAHRITRAGRQTC